jgi:hypothetical protein
MPSNIITESHIEEMAIEFLEKAFPKLMSGKIRLNVK